MIIDVFDNFYILYILGVTSQHVAPLPARPPPTHFSLPPSLSPPHRRPSHQVHEFGHCLTTKKLGGTVDGILLWPLGGLSFLGPTDALEGDLKVALAGPMTHIPMGFLWWAIYAAVKGPYRSLWPANGIFMNALSTPSG